jgi:hypothetical protein
VGAHGEFEWLLSLSAGVKDSPVSECSYVVDFDAVFILALLTMGGLVNLHVEFLHKLPEVLVDSLDLGVLFEDDSVELSSRGTRLKVQIVMPIIDLLKLVGCHIEHVSIDVFPHDVSPFGVLLECVVGMDHGFSSGHDILKLITAMDKHFELVISLAKELLRLI